MKIISIGEVLWDVVGTTEHLGGAPFNFAAHLKQLSHDVYFITAVGEDERGERILQEMSRRGLPTEYVSRDPNHPTGAVTVTVTNGQPSFTIHRPAAYDYPRLSQLQMKDLLSPAPDWIYYGTLLQMSDPARELTTRVLDSARETRRFYDVNLRTRCYNAPLVRELLAQADVVKLNDEEVTELARMLTLEYRTLEQFCRACATQFDLEAVCITRGARGCALLLAGVYQECRGYHVTVADAIGAGDAFAAAFLHGIGSGFSPVQIADLANRVGAIVASRPGALPKWTLEEALALK